MNGISIYNVKQPAKTLSKGDVISQEGKFWYVDSFEKEGEEICVRLCSNAEVIYKFFHKDEKLTITKR